MIKLREIPYALTILILKMVSNVPGQVKPRKGHEVNIIDVGRKLFWL
jgi:hypothetical protein